METSAPQTDPIKPSLYKRFRDYVVLKILHADDPPHKIALGFALAVFIAFTPTVGLQMVLVVLFSWIFRANKAVGVPVVWISNPATMLPIFYVTYYVGCLLLGMTPTSVGQWWDKLSAPPPGWWPAVKFYWMQLWDFAAPLWLGSAVIAATLAVPSYYLLLVCIRWYRMKRWGSLEAPKRTNAVEEAESSDTTDARMDVHDAA